MDDAKPFEIDKRLLYEAYKKVKFNKGSSGIDHVDMETYDMKLGMNLYNTALSFNLGAAN